MAELHKVDDVVISAQQREKLRAGESVTVRYHTPRMLQGKLGIRNGAFDVREVDGDLFTSDIAEFKRYVELQGDIRRIK